MLAESVEVQIITCVCFSKQFKTEEIVKLFIRQIIIAELIESLIALPQI